MKKLLSLLLALLLIFSLCACGSSSRATQDSSSQEMSPAEAPVADYAANSGYGLGMAGGGGEAGGSELPSEDPQKIIYSSEVTVETTAFDETVEKLFAMVEDYEGWIESSSINGSNYYDRSRGYNSNRSATYSLRIPSEKFSQLMNSLSQLGNVPYSYTYTQNVSAQYYDTQARLTAYTTQEQRLLEMMEQAETVSDVIAIEEKLTELRYQIESLQSSLNNWDRQVSYSSVYLDIVEVQEYTAGTESQISYGRQLWLALSGGLRSVGNFFKDLLVLIAGALPSLIILAVLVLVLLPVYKKLRARRMAKKHPAPPARDDRTE